MNGLLILAGGKATRLENKPFIEFKGVPMLKLIYDEICDLFSEVVVSERNSENENLIKKLTCNSGIVYDHNNFSSINSPLVGIVSAFQEMKSETVFVVSCDVPLIKKDAVKLILSEIRGFDAAVPVTGSCFIEPLFAAYKRTATLKAGEKALNLNKLSVRDAISELNVNYVPAEKFRSIDPMLLSFRNVNSIEDLNSLIKIK